MKASLPCCLCVVALSAAMPRMVLAESRPGALFANLPLSVRQTGMGGVSLVGQDILRAWSNPALLVEQETAVELAASGVSMFGGEQAAGGLGAGIHLTRDWTVGVLASYYAVSAPDLDQFGRPLGSDLDQNVLSMAAATGVRLGFLRLGTAFRYLSEDLAGDTASAVAADVGLMAMWEGFAVGAAMRNLGRDLRPEEDGVMGEALPTEVRAGASYTYEPWHLSLGVEYAGLTEAVGTVGAGVEWWAARYLGLRLGASGMGQDAEPQLTAGLSVLFRRVGIDYAAGMHTILGLTNRASISYSFGPKASDMDSFDLFRREWGQAPVLSLGKQRTLAVAEFDAKGVPVSDASVISDLFRTEIVKQETFIVVEKSRMDEILQEQAFQQVGCTVQECAVKLGRLLNVNYLIVGSIGLLFDRYVLSISVVDIETGKVVYSDARQDLSQQDVPTVLHEIAARLSGAVKK